MTGLLMTRPREASERFVASLPTEVTDRVSVCYAPLLEIVPLAEVLDFGAARGVIFSSANGVRTAARLTDRRDLPCLCVGEATTRAARAAGWRAEFAGETAKALVDRLPATRPEPPLLHLRGRHARGDIAARLTNAGCPTTELAIYDQRLLPFSPMARALLSGTAPVIVPLFSPRTARQFADLATGQAPLYLAALSEAVAEPILSIKSNALEIADRPDATALAEVVVRLSNLADRVEGGGPPK